MAFVLVITDVIISICDRSVNSAFVEAPRFITHMLKLAAHGGDARCISRFPSPRCAGRDVFCYFDNDAKVKAPRDARALADIIPAAGARIVMPDALHGEETNGSATAQMVENFGGRGRARKRIAAREGGGAG
jgi:hypothetical protein